MGQLAHLLRPPAPADRTHVSTDRQHRARWPTEKPPEFFRVEQRLGLRARGQQQVNPVTERVRTPCGPEIAGTAAQRHSWRPARCALRLRVTGVVSRGGRYRTMTTAAAPSSHRGSPSSQTTTRA
jgi:hypothetical protein